MQVRVSQTPEFSGATLIVGVLEGTVPLSGSEDALAGVDPGLLDSVGFEGKAGELLVVPHPEADAMVLVGLGDEVSFNSLRAAAGDAIRKVKTDTAVTLLALADLELATSAVVEGSLLGSYSFAEYKSEAEPPGVSELIVVGGTETEASSAVIVAEATALARDWINTPAKDKAPAHLANVVHDIAQVPGLTVEIWDEDKIDAERLGALQGVASASDRPARVVVISYRPEQGGKHLALVGKGIIFDSGGLSIKPSTSMEEMKDDMSGAAAVMAAAIGIAKLGLPVHLTAIAPLTDNAVGGDAIRPGDVLSPVAGPTIEVLNTDAEGRLILADGLGLAQTFEPDLIVDVATLTGAVSVGLGRDIAAVFGSDQDVADQMLAASERAGEEFWQLPLHQGYRKSLDSNIADIKNISGTRYGGAIVAALFLAEYVGEYPWAHLDIAGPARTRETRGEMVKGGAGYGVRTLIELARAMAE